MKSDRQKSYFLLRTAVILAFAALAAVAISIVSPALQAQDFNNYQPVKCVAPIPQDLLTTSSSKYEQQKRELEGRKSGKEAKSKDAFLLQSSFVLDELLLSGRVLFNDPISEYVTKIKDFILRENEVLKGKIRIYVVKSPVVNAFATNDGILLINIGLLAHLNSEAEMAFVLCHEIQHYIRKHPINAYVTSEKIKMNARMLGLQTAEDMHLAKTQYSREQETEADGLGFELYKESGYALSAIDGAFDVLRYSYLPYEEGNWSKRFFEWEYLKFPAGYHRDSTDSIAGIEDYDDQRHSHPNIAKRRGAIHERMGEAETEGPQFIFGEEEFERIRKICRFETSGLLLQSREYEHAIYNSYLLLREEPNSAYLEKIIAKSIYGLSHYKTAGEFAMVHYKSNKAEGNRQQLLYFFEQADGEDLNLLALRYCWKASLKYPQDKELRSLADAIMDELFLYHEELVPWLERKVPEEFPEVLTEKQKVVPDAIAAGTGGPDGGVPDGSGPDGGGPDGSGPDGSGPDGSGPDGIKPKEKQPAKKEIAASGEKNVYKAGDTGPGDTEKKDESTANEFLKWSLVDLFSEEAFATAFAEREFSKEPREVVRYVDPFAAEKARKKATVKGQHLGIDKVVFVQSLYKKIYHKAKTPVQYLASEAGEIGLRETIASLSDRLGLNYEFLEDLKDSEADVERFNDAATINLWISDHFANDSEHQMVNSYREEARALAEKYGTSYFAWNGVVHVKKRLTIIEQLVLVYFGIGPQAPFFLYKAFKNYHDLYMVNLVFDVESSSTVMANLRRIKSKDKPFVIKGHLYDALHQIKSKR